ncbi:MAG: hypothetical protein ABW166_00600 [Sedimenticola sp.]
MQLETIRDEIKEHNTSSKSQAEKYESTKCWSYAYLSRWVVLERGLKSLYDSHNKQRIRKGALEWINYLDGKTTKAPNKIKDFSVQTRNIPQYSFITDLLGKCNSVKVALDSNDKYRPKRNRIAHKAEEFRSEKGYLGYKQAVDDAIKQLLTKLTQKVNASK